MPGIVIGDQKFEEKGWFLNEKPETLSESIERAKEALRIFKKMALDEK